MNAIWYPGVERSVTYHSVVRVSRHKKYLHSRSQRGEPTSQLRATHPGHHHVGEQKVDGVRMLLAEEERL
jgi:hypothetical protein